MRYTNKRNQLRLFKVFDRLQSPASGSFEFITTVSDTHIPFFFRSSIERNSVACEEEFKDIKQIIIVTYKTDRYRQTIVHDHTLTTVESIVILR